MRRDEPADEATPRSGGDSAKVDGDRRRTAAGRSVEEDMNETIFVTGAASGIGRATALLFAGRGWFVGCYDVDVDGARKTAEACRTACHGRLDVTSFESWRLAVADFEAQTAAAMSVLFNCAGILRMGRFEQIGPDACKKQVDVNVMGVVLGVHACLPALERSRGTIVNMSSASAVYGSPELAVYSATKFAVRALTEALDIEFKGKGVRVCDVMPGYVDTPMVRSQDTPAQTVSRMGVKLKAEDVAELVWKAVRGKSLHYMPQTELKLLTRINGVSPELARAVMHRVARVSS
jgi:NAD(P)-dependent dehydrogenase (short-subunit alcohol dehydrogenase family)